MPFLPPNQQRQSTEGTNYNKQHNKFIFFNCNRHFAHFFQTITVSECRLTELLSYIFLKNIFVFLRWKCPAQGTSTVTIVSAHFRPDPQVMRAMLYRPRPIVLPMRSRLGGMYIDCSASWSLASLTTVVKPPAAFIHVSSRRRDVSEAGRLLLLLGNA